MKNVFSFVVIFFLILNLSNSQIKDDINIDSQLKNQFEATYGNGWLYDWNINSTPHRIFGKSSSFNFDALDPNLSESEARKFIASNRYLFNLNNENLELWVNEFHGNVRYLIFNQQYKNIPIWNARIDLRYSPYGELVMIGHDAFPAIQLNTVPSLTKEEALLNAKLYVDFNESLNDEVTSDPQLYIWVERKEQPIYHLAWLFELFVHSVDKNDHVPVHRWKIFVDAHNGEILERFDLVRTASVEGHVTGPVKDNPFGMATERGLPHVKVSVSGVGDVYTDEDGHYSIDIGDVERSVNIKLEGLYLNTNNQNGSDGSITRIVYPGTIENFNFGGLNSIPGERDTYFHANLIHDFVKNIHSGFDGADYQMVARVNIGSEDSYWPCNAYWDYSAINLFSEGGGCAATDQMADVIYHEYGHGLQQFIYEPYSPNYSSSGLSEGCSDYWAMTLTNSPCLGNGFFGEGTCLRDGNNNLQYPGNSCGGQVHCLGEYIMGSLWKMRENLIELHGYEEGVSIADDLFYWGQTGRPTTDLDFLTEIYLADDNDGNLQNGTLNFNQICSAFESHNISISSLPECDAAFADLEFSIPNLDFTLSTGNIETEEIIISNVGELGSVMSFSAGVSPFSAVGDGPDLYGNFWSDSDLDLDISFEWIDINGLGTQYSFSNNDEAGEQINIGFAFPFLGEVYSECFINANGWIGFGSDSDAWENTNIPSSSAPGPAIFGFWDDLNPVNDNCNEYCSGNVYYYNDEDKFIVWFENVAHWWTNYENSFYDFQFVLYTDGRIDLNYKTLTGTHSATVGIQNAAGSDGMKVSFDEDYLHNSLSLKFSQGPDWISVTPAMGEVNSGSSETLLVTVDATNLEENIYAGYLRLVTSGGNAGLPVSMSVTGEQIIFGDINFDNSINIQDIIILINFILGIDEAESLQFNAADMNSDNSLNIQDIILIVNIILS